MVNVFDQLWLPKHSHHHGESSPSMETVSGWLLTLQELLTRQDRLYSASYNAVS